MKERGRGDGLRQVTTGLVMIAGGAALVLDQMGVIEIGSLASWWPLLVVLLGLGKATAPPDERDPAEGVNLMLIGVWLLICVHHWMGLTYRNSWPLIFVAFGSKMVLRALMPAPPSIGAKARAAARAAAQAAERASEQVSGMEDRHA